MVQHDHHIRANVQNCMIPRATGPARSSFFYTAIQLWNSLPLEIKLSQSKQAFQHIVSVVIVCYDVC